MRRLNSKQMKRKGEMVCTWEAFGSPKNHTQLMEMLLDDADVRKFRF